jgi:plastocyanin
MIRTRYVAPGLLVVLLGAGAAIAAPAGSVVPTAPAVSHASIAIVNNGGSCTSEFCYQPASVTVRQAGTVTWTNRSAASHTVTRCDPTACPGAGPGTGTDPAFGSGVLGAGATFSVTFHGKGTYNYYCQIHGFAVMHGTVTVLAFAVSASKLPSGSVGSAYSTTMHTLGGKSPYHWTLTKGALPKGLALSGAGVISGTPTRAGKASFTVSVTDSSSPVLSAKKALTITIS